MDHIDKDEELVCPLCGGRVLWMPVSRIYVCKHCKQSYSEVNGVYLRKERKAITEKSSAVGDAAKLREALIDVVKRLEAYVGCDHHTFHPTATTCDGITSVGKCGKIGTCAAIFKARAALAAPPRQCDLMGWRTAWKTWREKFHPETPVGYSDVVKGTEAFMDWFTAPATGKEGGSNGN